MGPDDPLEIPSIGVVEERDLVVGPSSLEGLPSWEEIFGSRSMVDGPNDPSISPCGS